MEKTITMQDGANGDYARVPGASAGVREPRCVGRRGCKGTRGRTIIQRLWHGRGALVALAATAVVFAPEGCGVADPVIEVAVLYWARVRNAELAPVPGRSVYFAAARVTNGVRDDSTAQRRTATTSADGRTYLDVRFSLGSDQAIVLVASTTLTNPLTETGLLNAQWIDYHAARAQEEKQDGNGLAAFELTSEFIE